jgi:hypothetical protein
MRTPLYVLLAVSLAACGSTETGNATHDGPLITLSMQLSAVDGAPLASDKDDVAFTFSTARAFVESVEFDLPDGETCAEVEVPAPGRCQGTKIRYDGGWVVDLVAGTSEPPLEDLALPPGQYRRVDIRIKSMDPDDTRVSADDPLRDHALVATGSWASPDGAAPFALALAFTEDLRFENDSPLDLSAAAPATLLLGLDAAAWFSEAPLAECAADGDLDVVDGVLQINDGRSKCSAVEGDIKDHLKRDHQLDRR